MGKYNNSNIHNRYSDWHWQMIHKNDKYKRLYCSDIDRLWHEYDFNKKDVVGVFDLKYEGNNDGLTATEKGVYDWYLRKGAKVYIVFINQEFTQFRVVNYENNTETIYSETKYADFLLSLRGKPYYFPGTTRQYDLIEGF